MQSSAVSVILELLGVAFLIWPGDVETHSCFRLIGVTYSQTLHGMMRRVLS